MITTCTKEEAESSAIGIFELPGEPAIVINGLPPMPSSEGDLFPSANANEVNSHRNVGFAEWLVGREVRKVFGEQFYTGKVIEFDKGTGWYRVVYEDGDFEDLEWNELSEILQPLDITVPLKTLAMKIIKKKQNSVTKSNKGKKTGNP